MANTRPSIAVILATHNGANVLPDVLNGYAHLHAPDCDWRMVVVDNASTDRTAEILESFRDRLPLEILFEPVPSKNQALNRALDHVGLEPDLFVLTDDDAIPQPDFLREWRRVIDAYPQYELFGGLIRLHFRQPPEPWLAGLRRRFPELYAEIDRAEDGPMIAEDIFGPNMAVRRSIFAKGLKFDPRIGPNSSQKDYPMGSENEFCLRVVRETGAQPWFASGPKVHHIVRPNQMTKAYVERRAYKHGRGFAMRQAGLGDGRVTTMPTFLGEIRQIGRRIAASLRSIDAMWEYNWHQGYRDWIAENHSDRDDSRPPLRA